MKLTCMRGWSGSGKSTKAAEIAKETGAVIVNRDLLRLMMLGSYWTGKKDDEDRVSVAEEAQVIALLKSGVSVVVDATHLHSPYLRRWAKLATRLGAEFEVVDCRTPQADCAIRNMDRRARGERHVEGAVISKQATRYPMHKWPTITAPAPIEVDLYIPPLHAPEAIIVDIDGTLAHMSGRSPYDYTRVTEDSVDIIVRDLVLDWQAISPRNREVILLSGRDDSCRRDTLIWINRNQVPGDHLLMRPSEAVDHNGNKLPDWIVKLDLFNKYIRHEYNVQFVLDDRNQVVDMWRKLGLKCLQVAPGDF